MARLLLRQRDAVHDDQAQIAANTAQHNAAGMPAALSFNHLAYALPVAISSSAFVARCPISFWHTTSDTPSGSIAISVIEQLSN